MKALIEIFKFLVWCALKVFLVPVWFVIVLTGAELTEKEVPTNHTNGALWVTIIVWMALGIYILIPASKMINKLIE